MGLRLRGPSMPQTQPKLSPGARQSRSGAGSSQPSLVPSVPLQGSGGKPGAGSPVSPPMGCLQTLTQLRRGCSSIGKPALLHDAACAPGALGLGWKQTAFPREQQPPSSRVRCRVVGLPKLETRGEKQTDLSCFCCVLQVCSAFLQHKIGGSFPSAIVGCAVKNEAVWPWVFMQNSAYSGALSASVTRALSCSGGN